MIIADDFTGALDSGVQFVLAGMSAALELRAGTAAVDVRVHSTESRNVSEEEAVSRCRAAASTHGHGRLFKKIDSTMRGHVGAEIEALLDAGGIAKAVVCPAAPAAGRTVVDGLLSIRGVPLHETAFAHDPHWPARTSDVAALLRRPCTVMHTAAATAHAIAAAPTRIVVVDARTDDDLARIARAAHDAGALLCGSLGLARAWATILHPSPPPPTVAPPHSSRPLLIVAGSLHPTTHAQIERLKFSGAPMFEHCDDVAHIAAALASQGTAVLRAGREHVAGGVTAMLADCAARIAHALPLGGLVLTGGDTAAAVCHALDADAVRIGGEIDVGVPWGVIVGGAAHGATIVTKAGGFGGDDAIGAIVARLRHAR
jgi:uncharacterized protein YgbK (DUF1537 family)